MRQMTTEASIPRMYIAVDWSTSQLRAALSTDTGNMLPWWQAGAGGFGIGSALYKPGIAIDELEQRANAFVQAINALRIQDSDSSAS